MSFKSSVGACVDRPPPTDSWRGDIDHSFSSKLVEEFINSLADALEPARLRRGQVRTVDVPGLGRDLVLGDPVRRCLRVTHSWETLKIAQPQIHGIRNLRRE